MHPLITDVTQKKKGLKKLTIDRRLVHMVGALLIPYPGILLKALKCVITIGKDKYQILGSRGQDPQMEGRSRRIETQDLEKATQK